MVEALRGGSERVKELAVKGSRVARVMLDSISNQIRMVVLVRGVSLQLPRGNYSGFAEDLAGL